MRGSLKDETMYKFRAQIVFERHLLRRIRLIRTNASACNVTIIPDINPIRVSTAWILYLCKLRRPAWMNNTSILMLALLLYSLSLNIFVSYSQAWTLVVRSWQQSNCLLQKYITVSSSECYCFSLSKYIGLWNVYTVEFILSITLNKLSHSLGRLTF